MVNKLENTSSLLLNEVTKQCNPEHYINKRFHEAVHEVPTLEGESKNPRNNAKCFIYF